MSVKCSVKAPIQTYLIVGLKLMSGSSTLGKAVSGLTVTELPLPASLPLPAMLPLPLPFYSYNQYTSYTL
jgi:hypothetical protein